MRKTAIGMEERRILVCDDERHIVRLIQVNMECNGHRVTTAFDGREAIDLLQNFGDEEVPPFDTVILDLGMPRVSGYEVLEYLRSRTSWQIKVILMGKEEELEGVRDRPAKADLYLAKPFNPMRLL